MSTETDTQLTTTPQNKMLSTLLAQSTQEKIRALIPPSMTFERFNRLAVSLVHRNPELAACEPVSFFVCLSDCAALGLYPDPVTGQAYFIARWNKKKQCKEVTLLAGYRGLRSIALRSNEILDLWTGIVRTGDVFKIVRAPRQEIVHEIDPMETGEIIGYYSVAALRSGLTSFEWMNLAKIEKVKREALDRLEDWQVETSPWTAWEDEMGRKTVIRRHFKSLPLRPEDQEAAARELEAGDGLKNVTGTAEPELTPEQKLIAENAAAARATRPTRRSGVAATKPVEPAATEPEKPAAAQESVTKEPEKPAEKTPEKPAEKVPEKKLEPAPAAKKEEPPAPAAKAKTPAARKFPCKLVGDVEFVRRGPNKAGVIIRVTKFYPEGADEPLTCYTYDEKVPLPAERQRMEVTLDETPQPAPKPPALFITAAKAVEVDQDVPAF